MKKIQEAVTTTKKTTTTTTKSTVIGIPITTTKTTPPTTATHLNLFCGPKMKKELVQGIRTPLLGFSSSSSLASSSSSGVHEVPESVLLCDGRPRIKKKKLLQEY